MTTEVRVLLDVPFYVVATRRGERTLVMDLWLPQHQAVPMPTIVYIHGGGWQGGTQYRPPFQPRFCDQGIAIAAITYRFTGEAPFPAMLHDCKTAVRWLRAHAADYQLDPECFGAWGISAGGHLAPLLGTTNTRLEWEGDGPYREFSSAVQAVCAWCGPTDLARVATDPVPGEGMIELVSGVVGGPLAQHLDIAAQASPITHVRPDNPPHLLIHGADDPIVPAYHATSLYDKMRAAGVDVELLVMPGVGHILDGIETARAVNRFFNRCLRGRAVDQF